MRKDFIANVCHHGCGGIRMGVWWRRRKRADIQRSIMEMRKGLGTRENEQSLFKARLINWFY